MAYTNIDDPSAHFQAETYTGNSTSPRSVTLSGNSDMQPDWTWIKTRNGPYYHYAFDSSRTSGSSYYRLIPSETSTEYVDTVSQLTSFNTDGFTLTGSGSMANVNWSTQNYVAWNWKANGGTTTSNTDGSITSTVQVNQDAGFSIGTFTGNGTSGATVGHGLGVKPDMLILKSRNSPSGAAMYWIVGHVGLDGMAGLKNLFMNENWAVNTQSVIWANTAPTSSVFSVGTNAAVNYTNNDMLFYAFKAKQGYSRFSSYVGNGNVNGAFVYTGFKPAFVIIKRSDGVTNWRMFDNKRSGYNGDTSQLYPNLNNAEDAAGDQIDLLSNGFKNRTASGDQNISGASYIYMAFAENPFVTSTGIPTTAR